MYARMHTLSTTSTHKSSQAVMDPSEYQSSYTAWILWLFRALRGLWNEYVLPGVKCKIMREHSVVDQDHKPTFNFNLIQTWLLWPTNIWYYDNYDAHSPNLKLLSPLQTTLLWSKTMNRYPKQWIVASPFSVLNMFFYNLFKIIMQPPTPP